MKFSIIAGAKRIWTRGAVAYSAGTTTINVRATRIVNSAATAAGTGTASGVGAEA